MENECLSFWNVKHLFESITFANCSKKNPQTLTYTSVQTTKQKRFHVISNANRLKIIPLIVAELLLFYISVAYASINPQLNEYNEMT